MRAPTVVDDLVPPPLTATGHSDGASESLAMTVAPGSLAEAILSVSRVLVGVAARSLAKVESDITVPQFRLLVLLAERGSLRPADLAESLDISASQATRLCDRLVRKRLISRRGIEEDRRGVLVSLSKHGTEVVEAVTEIRLDEIERLVSAIPVSERRVLLGAFNMLAKAAGEVPDSEWPRFWEL